MLLFRSGGALMVVPLGLVARLEVIPRDRLERPAGSQPGSSYEVVTQYRGALMPLVPLSGSLDQDRASHPVLVFSDGAGEGGRERCVGLAVDEIVDVVEERLRVELQGQCPGTLGTAVVAGQAAGVLDTCHWLTNVYHDWFQPKCGGSQRRRRLLIVEDSSFFRQLLLPVLAAAGYAVTAAAGAAQALRLRDTGATFDAIISDIEMPDMDGIPFVRSVRVGGAWAHLPVIALSGRVRPRDIEAAREAGFTDYIGKFEQELLLARLRQCLEHASHEHDAPMCDTAAA